MAEAEEAPSAPRPNINMYDDNDDDDDEEDDDYQPPSFKSAPQLPKPKAAKAGGSRIMSLRDYQDEDEEQDEKGQAFYAGGSETSGQQIIGPNKKQNPENLIKDLFRKAKE